MPGESLSACAFLAVMLTLQAGAGPLDFAQARPCGAGFVREGDAIVCTAREVNVRGSTKPQKVAGASW